ncbi:hypothetical protein FOT91_29365, partial [Klebsiella michiganensis]|nr:hypothetical protein [Klebsiella michiganensis]
GKTLLHGDVLMWLMKTLLTSGCTNQRGAGHELPLFAHNGLRSLIAVSITLCLMPAWYSQVDSTGFRSSSLKTVPVFRTP